MDNSRFYQDVFEEVEDAVNNSIIKLQQKYGIDNGDCEPMLSLKYDEDLDGLVETIRMILERQMN